MLSQWLNWLATILTAARYEPQPTLRRLSPQEIERYRRELQLSEEQVEKLRQGLPIRLVGAQLPALQRRMHEPDRPPTPVNQAPPSSPPPDPNGLSRYYETVRERKWRGIPEDMRGNLRMDRWGTLYHKNPRGRGWREKGSDDPYDILPNSSW
ncbi:MAG: hypothetical protein U0931_24030 [Vulcanimicrobiota bacterium]